MKKAYRINLSGAVFNIDDDAYQKLKAYLDELKDFYSGDPDGSDIIEDIENRIAELFQDQLSGYRQVIISSDVEKVIETLGHPQEIENAPTSKNDNKVHRKIFRHPEDRILGGVCGGLGIYFDINPNWIRLGFVLSVVLFGAGTLLYILLWILVPLAQTSSELLEMRGEAITIRNIEKAIRNEFQKVKRQWSRN